MRLIAAGVNHKSAPIEIRERLALPAARQVEELRKLVALPRISEAVVLATCNRFELYVTERSGGPGVAVAQLIAGMADIPRPELSPHLYVHEGQSAACHLFEVASGADSMVVGECEILGQVKDAADLARNAGTLGAVLSRLTDTALQTGKRARAETNIGHGCASVASVAVGLARQICGDPRRAVVILIGAGDTAELTLERLRCLGAQRVLVTNRTHERGICLAAKYGACAIPFAELYEALVEADVVITSTSAPHPIVRADPMRQVVRRRGARPLFIIDLAVPRDVEPETGNLDNVFLYNIDALQEAAEEALRSRMCEIPRVRQICQEAAEEFWRWVASLDLVPTMVDLRDRAEAIRQRELRRAIDDMGNLSERQRKQLHLLTKRLVRGIIDEPLARLRAKASQGDGAAYAGMLRELFGLEQASGPCPPVPSSEEQTYEEGQA